MLASAVCGSNFELIAAGEEEERVSYRARDGMCAVMPAPDTVWKQSLELPRAKRRAKPSTARSPRAESRHQLDACEARHRPRQPTRRARELHRDDP